MTLIKRQLNILTFIEKNDGVQTQDIRDYISKTEGKEISRITIIRDLEILLENNFIQKKGKGRSIAYKISPKGSLLAPIDYGEYFNLDPDKRIGIKKTFQQDIFERMKELFSKKEISNLEKANDKYRKIMENLSPTLLRKEFERLTIELSWKSSRIEGNTYSLIDTEILLTQEKEAKGHKKEEAVMLLNHKKALEYIQEKSRLFKKISLHDIEDVHALLIK